MPAFLHVDHLCKTFGSLRAVNGVSLEVERGEVLGFLGPNGAGKSTTMKIICGFLAPTSGRAVIDGFDIVTAPVAAKRRIGYLPEGAPLYGDMTPAALLDFVAGIRGLPKGQQHIEAAIDAVDIAHVLQQPIETLSKGFKRRVGLAQAILHDPDLLILDEPTDGLDPNQKHQVRGLIKKMAKTKAIVISTHILEEVAAVCSRAAIINHGTMLFDGKPKELPQVVGKPRAKIDEVFRLLTNAQNTNKNPEKTPS